MRRKLMLLLVCAVMMLSLAACGDVEEPITPPAPVSKVNSVTIQYNDKNLTGGVLSVDLSMTTVELKAVVQKTDDKVDGTVSFTSSMPTVASVTTTGTVTLVSKGETVVSAIAGDKRHDIVLVVGDDYSTTERYRVTVVGGRSDISSAAAGTYITISATIPEHKNFVRWEYEVGGEAVDDLWINGNIFAMPNGDITVTAVYEDMLYTVNVVGGTIMDNETGTLSGETMAYKLTYDTTVSVVANDDPEGKMFVGWDFKVKNNRVGELGVREYGPFNVPDETLTVWAVYSTDSKVIGPGITKKVPFGDVGRGHKAIVDGIPNGEEKDPDLDNMTGYRFAIPANQVKVQAGDYTAENLTGSLLDNLKQGSQTLKVVFKNHHATLPLTVEFYATYYGTRITTGHITIPANSVVTKHFIARLGINKPWMGFVVRENVGGEVSDTVLLDMVVQMAATYPEGDKQFEISGAAQWVNIGAYNSDTGWARERTVNNAQGMTVIAVYSGNITENGYTRTNITNMPTFDEAKPTTRIYFRAINANQNIGNFKLNFGTNTDPTAEGGSIASRTLKLTADSSEVFYVDVPRTNNDQIYFSFIKVDNDNTDALYGHNFVIQMAYNNVIGAVEE